MLVSVSYLDVLRTKLCLFFLGLNKTTTHLWKQTDCFSTTAWNYCQKEIQESFLFKLHVQITKHPIHNHWHIHDYSPLVLIKKVSILKRWLLMEKLVYECSVCKWLGPWQCIPLQNGLPVGGCLLAQVLLLTSCVYYR